MSVQGSVPQGAPPQPAPPAKKSGSGCMMGCLGCGCVSVLLLVVLLVGGGFFAWKQGQEVTESISMLGGASDEEGSSGGFGLNLSTLKTLSEGGVGGGGSGDGGLESMLDGGLGGAKEGAQQGAFASAESVIEKLEQPLASRDFKKVESSLKDWENTRAAKRFHTELEKFDELPDDESLTTAFKKLRYGSSMLFRLRDLNKAYSSHVDKNGGDKYLAQQTQVLAIYRASQLAASNQAHEPWEQAIADALLADHDENQEAYQAARARLSEVSDKDKEYIESLPEDEQAELVEAFLQQMTLLPSAINRKSLENWAALSDGERQKIGEQYDSEMGQMTRILGALTSGQAENYMDWIVLEAMGP